MWPSTLRNVQRDQTACRSPAHAAGRRDPIRLRDVDGGCAKQGIAPIYGQQQKTYETVSAAAPISAVRFRHSMKSAARLPAAFKTRRNSSAAALAARAAHGRVSDRKIAARCLRCFVRPDRMLRVARLPRFYNKFRLQNDRSTTNAERAAERKLARYLPPGHSRPGCVSSFVTF